MREIKDADFNQLVAESKKVVLVDLYATWCGPCKALAPKLEELSQELSESAELVKLDIDQNPETPSKFHVRGVPTLLFFKDGKHVETLVGNQPKDKIEGLIKKLSKGSATTSFTDDF